MPISIQCPHCGKGFRVADTIAGKTARCAACSTPFEAVVLPANSQPTAPHPKPTVPQRAPSQSPAIKRPVAPAPPPPLEPLRDDLFDSLPPADSYQLASLPPAAPAQKPLGNWGAPATGFGIAPEGGEAEDRKAWFGGIVMLTVISPLLCLITYLELHYWGKFHGMAPAMAFLLAIFGVLALIDPKFVTCFNKQRSDIPKFYSVVSKIVLAVAMLIFFVGMFLLGYRDVHR